MIALIDKYQEYGALPIVIGYFNEDLQDDEKTGLKYLLTTCNLVNTFQSIIGYTPSSRQNYRQIFHILVHTTILNFINRLGILDETAGFASDHIPFFVDIDRTLFYKKMSSLLLPPHSILKSTNKENFKKYI